MVGRVYALLMSSFPFLGIAFQIAQPNDFIGHFFPNHLIQALKDHSSGKVIPGSIGGHLWLLAEDEKPHALRKHSHKIRDGGQDAYSLLSINRRSMLFLPISLPPPKPNFYSQKHEVNSLRLEDSFCF